MKISNIENWREYDMAEPEVRRWQERVGNE